jgi:hypothetical protein
MSAPLTPPDCDLQDFPFMPLHVARLRDSDLAAEGAPEACWYAVLLWAASWHQVPAASLPENDAVLTKLIGLGRDVKTFRKHRAGALRGFILCDDGRLYHEVVAEQALTSWRRKLEQRWRTECGRIKKANQRNKTEDPLPTFEEFHAALPPTSRLPNVPGDIATRPAGQDDPSPGTGGPRPPGNVVQETGRGTGTGRLGSDPNGSDDETPSPVVRDDLAELRSLDPKAGAWRIALKLLMDRGGFPQARARPMVGKWAKDHAPAELWKACEAAWVAGTLDPVSYVMAALDRIASEDNPFLNPTETRQRLWMQDFRASPSQWREHERGRRPGEAGCRVSPEIQREFGIDPAKPQPVGRSAA